MANSEWDAERAAFSFASCYSLFAIRYSLLQTGVSFQTSPVDDTPMQPRDRVERGQHRALLPGRQVGGVFARQHDASVERTEIVIVLLARRIAPLREATERRRLAMPADRDAVLELLFVLRVDLCAKLHDLSDALGRRERGPFIGVRTERIRAEQHALAGFEETG